MIKKDTPTSQQAPVSDFPTPPLEGYMAQPVKGDGNCMFYAMLVAHSGREFDINNQMQEEGLERRVLRLRSAVAEKIKTKGDNDSKWLDQVIPTMKNTLIEVGIDAEKETEEILTSYCDHMSENGTWGDHLVLEIIAEMLEVQIVVHSGDNGERILLIGQSGSQLHLYQHGEVHFTPYIPYTKSLSLEQLNMFLNGPLNAQVLKTALARVDTANYSPSDKVQALSKLATICKTRTDANKRQFRKDISETVFRLVEQFPLRLTPEELINMGWALAHLDIRTHNIRILVREWINIMPRLFQEVKEPKKLALPIWSLAYLKDHLEHPEEWSDGRRRSRSVARHRPSEQYHQFITSWFNAVKGKLSTFDAKALARSGWALWKLAERNAEFQIEWMEAIQNRHKTFNLQDATMVLKELSYFRIPIEHCFSVVDACVSIIETEFEDVNVASISFIVEAFKGIPGDFDRVKIGLRERCDALVVSCRMKLSDWGESPILPSVNPVYEYGTEVAVVEEIEAMMEGHSVTNGKRPRRVALMGGGLSRHSNTTISQRSRSVGVMRSLDKSVPLSLEDKETITRLAESSRGEPPLPQQYLDGNPTKKRRRKKKARKTGLEQPTITQEDITTRKEVVRDRESSIGEGERDETPRGRTYQATQALLELQKRERQREKSQRKRLRKKVSSLENEEEKARRDIRIDETKQFLAIVEMDSTIGDRETDKLIRIAQSDWQVDSSQDRDIQLQKLVQEENRRRGDLWSQFRQCFIKMQEEERLKLEELQKSERSRSSILCQEDQDRLLEEIPFLERALKAPKKGPVEVLKRIMDMGVDLERSGEDSNSMVTMYALRGDIRMLRLLKNKGVSLSKFDGRGWSPAIAAANFGQVNALINLKSLGVDLSESAPQGLSPATQAASQGRVNVLECLKSLGVDLTKSDDKGWSPATMAACLGKVEVLRQLQVLGVDLTQSDEGNRTPATVMAEFGQVEVLKFLHELGVDLSKSDAREFSPATMAACVGKVEVLRQLQVLGVDLTKFDDRGRSPATLMAEFGQVEVLKFLHELGVDLSRSDNRGHSPATIAANFGKVEVLRQLQVSGVDLTQSDEGKKTPATLMAEFGQVEVLKFLHELGVDLSKSDARGFSPATRAACVGKVEVLRQLQVLGVDLSRSDAKGDSPIKMALFFKNADAFEYLSTLHGETTGKPIGGKALMELCTDRQSFDVNLATVNERRKTPIKVLKVEQIKSMISPAKKYIVVDCRDSCEGLSSLEELNNVLLWPTDLDTKTGACVDNAFIFAEVMSEYEVHFVVIPGKETDHLVSVVVYEPEQEPVVMSQLDQIMQGSYGSSSDGNQLANIESNYVVAQETYTLITPEGEQKNLVLSLDQDGIVFSCVENLPHMTSGIEDGNFIIWKDQYGRIHVDTKPQGYTLHLRASIGSEDMPFDSGYPGKFKPKKGDNPYDDDGYGGDSGWWDGNDSSSAEHGNGMLLGEDGNNTNTKHNTNNIT